MPLSRTGLQWTIVVFNTLCVAVGILCVVESVFELQKYSYGMEEFTEKIVQICIGSALVISAFVGCAGAVNGSVKILSGFVVLLLALIGLHVWRLWRCSEDRVRSYTKELVNYTWIEMLVDTTKMDPMQETYECCGIKGYTDYTSIGLKVPGSCYKFDENNKRSFYPYGQGCMAAVTDGYLNIYQMEKWTNVGLLCFEFLGITLSFLLIYTLTADTRRYTY